MLWIGTQHSSASEQPCTLVRNIEKPGRVFYYPFNATSKYSYTVIVHHITHEIFNNIVTVSKLHQVTDFPVVFEESAILPANGRNQKWKCWLWGVQEIKCHEIYTAGHGKTSPFQPWWSVRCAIPTFDVNQCSLRGSTFCFCLLRLDLAVTWARDENVETIQDNFIAKCQYTDFVVPSTFIAHSLQSYNI